MASTSQQVGSQGKDALHSVQEMGREALNSATDKFQDMRDGAQDVFKAGCDQISDFGQTLTDTVRERPLQVLLGAAVVGCMIGFFLRRK